MIKNKIGCMLVMAAITLSTGITALGQIALDPINGENEIIAITGNTSHKNKPITIQVNNDKRKCFFDQMQTDEQGNFKFQVGLEENEAYKGHVLVEGEKESFSFKTNSVTPPPEAKITNNEKIQQVLLTMIDAWQGKNTITSKEAMAYYHVKGNDATSTAHIKEKYKDETNLMYATDYVGNILGCVASGYDPNTYKNGEYVTRLAAAQKASGLFEVGKEGGQATQTSWSIVALDMTNATYDKEKAIKSLISKQTIQGDFGSIDHTAMCMMALENHKNIEGAQESIEKAKQYLLQNKTRIIEKENACTIATVIQGLIATGENPLAEKWTINDKTMLSALLSYQKQGKFEGLMEQEQSFMALADLTKKESMFTNATISSEGYSSLFVNQSSSSEGEKPTDPSKPTNPTNPEEKQSVEIEILGYQKTILNLQTISLKEGETLLDLTRRVAKMNGCNIEIKNGYVVGIDGLYEFDKGSLSGWKVKVNGKQITSGAAPYKLKGNETIEWYYVVDYTKDTNGNNQEAELERQIKEIKAMLEDVKTNEDKVVKMLGELSLNLQENAKKVVSPETLTAVLNDTKAFVALLDTINPDAQTQQVLDMIVKENLNTMQMTNKFLVQAKDNNKEIVDHILAENIKMITEALPKLQNNENMQKTILEIVKIVSTYNVDNPIAKLAPEELKAIINSRTQMMNQLQQGLKKNNITNMQEVENQLTIVLPNNNKEAIAVTLPENAMQLLNANGVNKLRITGNNVAVAISEKSFLKKDSNKPITVSIGLANRETLTAIEKEKIPATSMIVNLQITADSQKITEFATPIQVSFTLDNPLKQGKMIAVMHLKEDGSRENMMGQYDPLTGIINFEIHKGGQYFTLETTKFTDLKGFEWASKTIETMASLGFVNGKEEGAFNPQLLITRAEFTTIANKIMGYQAGTIKNPFKDVQNSDWYYKEVMTGYKEGLIKGKEINKFEPNGNISREEMAVIITRMLEQKGHKEIATNRSNLYKDANDIGKWAKNSINVCIEKNIIKGMPDNTLNPSGKANRAEATVMLYRVYQILNQENK